MTLPDGWRLVLALRAWIDEEQTGRNAERVVEYVCRKALSGHFGFFKLLIDVVDGKLHPTAEEELTFESGCAPPAGEDEQASDVSRAA
jgi:hypothetical protein